MFEGGKVAHPCPTWAFIPIAMQDIEVHVYLRVTLVYILMCASKRLKGHNDREKNYKK